MKKIKLTQNKYVLVDDKDFNYLNQFKWHAIKGRNTFYAARNIYKNGTRKYIRMHNLILGNGVDHIDNNGLNNQRKNLRLVTPQQNNMNQIMRKNNKSGYKGVYPRINGGFAANIRINRKSIHLGVFNDKIEAAKAYNQKAKELFGEYANLNNLA